MVICWEDSEGYICKNDYYTTLNVPKVKIIVFKNATSSISIKGKKLIDCSTQDTKHWLSFVVSEYKLKNTEKMSKEKCFAINI